MATIKSTVVTNNRIDANVSPPTKIVPKNVVLQDVTAATVGLENVDNTSDINKPVSTATQAALDLKANQSTTYTKTEVDTNIANLVNGAPGTLDTLNELAEALGDDNDYATTTAALIGQKQDTLTFGIANTNAVKMDNTSAAPGGGDIAIFASTGIMPKTFQSLQSDMGIPTLRSDVDQNIIDIAGKQNTLTFGTANTNAVKIDNTSAAANGGDIAIFASSGIMPKTFQSLKSDLGVDDKAPINNPSFTGYVGIGRTPLKLLDIKGGDFRITSSEPAIFLNDTDNNSDFGIKNNNGSFEILDTTNELTRLAIDSNGNVGIGTATPEKELDVRGDVKIQQNDNTAAALIVKGPATITHDLFKHSGVTGGFADNSNHYHTVQKINRITQQVGSNTANERVQEQYYAIEGNNLKNSQAAFWNWHRVSPEIANTSVSLTNLVGWDVSDIQDSSNRTATSQALFPSGGAEATTFTFDTAGNNPFTNGDVLQITVEIDFEGAIVAATNFAKVTAVSGATATVVLHGGNYKTTVEVPDGNSQTALTSNFSVNKIDTTQNMPLASSTGIDVLSDSTRTTTTDTFKLTFASAHGLELNDVITVITDGTGGFQPAEVAFVKSVGSTTEATFVYGRVFEPASRLALSDIAAGSVVGILKGTLDGLHRFTAGDQLMHFNADNQGRYKSYQIGPGSEVGADCIAIGKNVYNKDASTIKIGYDNNMLNIDSDGIDVAGDITGIDVTVQSNFQAEGDSLFDGSVEIADSMEFSGGGDLEFTSGGNISGSCDVDVTGSVQSSKWLRPGVYADTAARDAAITSPQAGMMVFITSGTKFQGYTGAAWVDFN